MERSNNLKLILLWVLSLAGLAADQHYPFMLEHELTVFSIRHHPRDRASLQFPFHSPGNLLAGLLWSMGQVQPVAEISSRVQLPGTLDIQPSLPGSWTRDEISATGWT